MTASGPATNAASALLEQVLCSMAPAVVVVDAAGRLARVNDIALVVLGLDSEEAATGRPAAEVLPEGLREILDRVEAATACGAEPPIGGQVRAARPEGGEALWCVSTARTGGEAGVTVLTFRDLSTVAGLVDELLSARAESDAQRGRVMSILDSVGDGVFTVDASLRITDFSRSMVALTGLPAEEALGRPCEQVLACDICGADCPVTWAAEHDQGVTDCRATVRTADRHHLPVLLSTRPVEGGEGMVVVVRETDPFGRCGGRSETAGRYGIVSRSPRIRALVDLLETVSDSDATVLIRGESGTGKEVFARAVHAASRRSDGPFVKVNCAAIPPTLLESELFGHVRGAFTDAVRDKVGRFRRADGGTIFLDEVGEIPATLQAKLLGVLQDRVVEPVGSDRSIPVDVRVVAATNRDLTAAIADGDFREDLFYRLCVIPMDLPPLRERPADVPLLVQHFLGVFDPEGRVVEVSERAMALLVQHPWPGNVRELENAVEHAVICSSGERIERRHLPGHVQASGGVDRGERASERDEVLEALKRCRWSRVGAARELGISRTTLWRRMKDLGIG